MKKNARKKKIVHSRFRILMSLLVFGFITISLGYNLFSNLIKIDKMKKEKLLLNKKYDNLAEEKENLEIDILKLKDPDYIAKYVREKYFYSKDGELILRIDE